jgi:regulatory protein
MPSRNGKRPAPVSGRTWTSEQLEAYALRYLGRFDCTEQRLRTVLHRKLDAIREGGAAEIDAATFASIEPLVDRFKALGYLNDVRFAERLLESLRQRGASTRKIRERLRSRGVSAEVANSLLADAHATSQDDLKAAIKWVKRRRLGAYRPAEQQKERFQRDLAALARAGFSFDVARRALAVSIQQTDESTN